MRQLLWTLPPEKEGEPAITKGAVLVTVAPIVYQDEGIQKVAAFAVCEDPDTGKIATMNITEMELAGMNPHVEPPLRAEIDRMETEKRMRQEIAARMHEKGMNQPPPGAQPQPKILPAGMLPPGLRPPMRRRPR